MTTAETRPPHRRGRPRRALLPGTARRRDAPGPGEPPSHVRRLTSSRAASRRRATSTATSTSARSSRCGAASGRWRAARSRSPRSATRCSTRSPTGRSSSSAPPRTRSRAFHNSCLHRGTQLRTRSGHINSFRCPYHGFSWNLDGTPPRDPVGVGLPPCRRGRRSACQRRRSGTWGGFVFVNIDPDGATARGLPRGPPVALRRSGPSRTATSPPTSSGRCRATGRWRSKPSSRRTTRMAVHPQLLPTAADSLTEYDVYGPHVSRMITAVGVSSEHLDRQLDDVEIVRAMLGSKDAEVTIEPGSSARTGARRTRPRLAAQAHRPRLLERHRRRAARRHRVLPVPELHAVGRLPDVVRLPLPPRRPRSRLVRDRHHGPRAVPEGRPPPAAPPTRVHRPGRDAGPTSPSSASSGGCSTRTARPSGGCSAACAPP